MPRSNVCHIDTTRPIHYRYHICDTKVCDSRTSTNNLAYSLFASCSSKLYNYKYFKKKQLQWRTSSFKINVYPGFPIGYRSGEAVHAARYIAYRLPRLTWILKQDFETNATLSYHNDHNPTVTKLYNSFSSGCIVVDIPLALSLHLYRWLTSDLQTATHSHESDLVMRLAPYVLFTCTVKKTSCSVLIR
jgi:hypothetical protein